MCWDFIFVIKEYFCVISVASKKSFLNTLIWFLYISLIGAEKTT